MPTKALTAVAVWWGREAGGVKCTPASSSGEAGCMCTHMLVGQGKQNLLVCIHADKAMWGGGHGPRGSYSAGKEWIDWCVTMETTPLQLSTSQVWSTSAEAIGWAPRAPKAALQAGVASQQPL